MSQLISEREFEEVWQPKLLASGDFFQFGDVCDQPAQFVWTITDSGEDDGVWYACPGFHLVNRIGYVKTKKPWTDWSQDAIYFLDDFSDQFCEDH